MLNVVLDASGEFILWLPVDPAIIALVVGILVLFILYWLWKFVVSLITGA